jgi:hypothetical protein
VSLAYDCPDAGPVYATKHDDLNLQHRHTLIAGALQIAKAATTIDDGLSCSLCFRSASAKMSLGFIPVQDS